MLFVPRKKEFSNNLLSVFNKLIFNSHPLNKKCAPLLLTPILALQSDVKHCILTI